jgi:16S rRNA (guanine966-N2)-methyltransferase
MGDRIRGGLFNKISDEIEGAEVLDTFAGSGSLGLEAISRGARSAIFVEKNREAASVIAANIVALGCQGQAKLVQADVGTWAKKSELKFDIIFADPPYDDTQFSTVELLFRLLKPNGLMILSYPGRGEAPTGNNGVVVVDNRSYGTAALAFYRMDNV